VDLFSFQKSITSTTSIVDMGHLVLVKKNPALTDEEFSKYWATRHAYVVVPYLTNHGYQYYAQIHSPKITPKVADPTLAAEIRTFSGGVELVGAQPGDPTKMKEDEPAWMKAYHEEVIVGDEKKFLKSEALGHIKWVESGSIEGDTLVVIEDGKAKVDVPAEFWAVWEEYKKKGEGESK